MLGMEDHQPARQGDQPGHQEHDPAALPQAVEIVEEKLIKLSHASCSGRPCYPGSAWAIPTATPAPSTVAAQGKSTCRGEDRKSNTSELQSLMRISYAVFCLKKKNITY